MKISFTGDIIFSGSFINKESDANCIDDKIAGFLADSDTCVCNIEGPVFSGRTRKDKIAHRNSPNILEFTTRITGNTWYVGNNHILDYDEAGLFETLDVAEKNKIQAFGAGRNIEEASKPIIFGNLCGIVGVRYNNKHGRATSKNAGCFIWDEDNLIKDRIREIKEKCKWCILVSHAGYEFCDIPLPDVRKKYHEFLDWGVDIIVGHHPHVVQNYEIVGKKIIFYSIGNFLFGTEFEKVHDSANVGMLLKIDLNNRDYTWSYLPILIHQDSAMVVATEAPLIFRNIDESRYRELLPIAITEYTYKREMKHIRFNIIRKDLPAMAKTRIVLSHIKKNYKIRKKYHSTIAKTAKNVELSKYL